MATYSSIKQAVATAANVARVVATNYDSIGSLPTSGNVLGEQALVVGDSSTDRLYIWEGSAWYQVALIQNSPTFTTSPDASYVLADDGVTTTVITLAATDPEGFPVTFSATTNVGFDSIATVSQDSSVFTVTPFSADSVGVSRSGTITFKASDGISVASAISTFTITFIITNSNYTTMLLKASANNGTNTTINDASSSNHSITVNGNAVAQAHTPYHPGGYSAYFDGSGDFLSIADHADFALGTSNFTAECWIYPTASPSQPLIFGQWSSPYAWAIQLSNNSSRYLRFLVHIGGYVDTISTNTTVPLNEWSHLALVRNGSTFTLYLNGVSALTMTNSGSITDSSSALTLGATASGGQPYQGYIRDARFVVGDAVYTADFTPPTSSLASTGSNTKLLACNGLPYIVDGSNSSHSISVAGNAYLERFGPYDYSSYSPSSHGSSVYFDGTGDYLKTPSSADFNLNNTAFTIEGWFYATAPAGNEHIWSSYIDTNNRESFYFSDSTTLNWWVNGSTRISATVVANNWHHFAIVDNNGTTTFYINGISQGTWSSTYTDGNRLVWLGTYNDGGYAPDDFTGYLSDIRYVKGTAVYTADFTPPTSLLTAITNTKLLTLRGSPNIYNAAGRSSVTTLNGDAKSSTAQTKNAESSIVFDGSGDTITIAEQVPRNERDDWTIEFWVRPNNVTNRMDMFSQYNSSSAGRMTLNMNNSGIVNFFQNGLTGNSGSSIAASSSLTANTWHHIAVTNNYGIRSMFIDGEYQGQSTGSQALADLEIMIGNAVDRTDYMNGYMEDIRLTKGLSRYPFIPTAETLTSGSLTKALACYAASETTAVYGAGSTSLSVAKNGTPSASDFGPADGMKSVYFDGNDDWLTIDLGSAIGTSDFCVEGWAYRDTSSGTANSRGVFSISDNTNGWSSSGSNISLQYRNAANGNEWAAYLNNGQRNITDTDTVMGKWYHFVVQRNGGTSYVFINGSMIYSIADTYDYSGKQYLAIGTYHSDDDWYGYISNLRVSVGSGSNFYANSFTPPTAELKA